ncbi:MAG: CvpA family protein [Chitinophagales bacterium]|nr:CvpA family protein [Chitinophagales bacterium]MDW8428727.1 CvpA family protein [Chitinophagales bacterium]
MWLDIACALVLLFGIWKGWKEGFIASLFTVLAWLAGLVGGLQLTAAAALFLRSQFGLHHQLSPVIAFVVVFVLIALAVYLVGKLLERFFALLELGWFNRLMGIVLRSGVYLFLLGVVVWLLNQAGLLTPEFKVNSRSYEPLLFLADFGLEQLQRLWPSVGHAVQELREFFDQLQPKLISSLK